MTPNIFLKYKLFAIFLRGVKNGRVLDVDVRCVYIRVRERKRAGERKEGEKLMCMPVFVCMCV